MNILFLKPAQAELNDAINFYDAEAEGLGMEFSKEVQSTILRIIENPHAWSPISKRTRRCKTKRFPYGIIYQVRNDKILIISVMHLHREPHSWRSRLPQSQQ